MECAVDISWPHRSACRLNIPGRGLSLSDLQGLVPDLLLLLWREVRQGAYLGFVGGRDTNWCQIRHRLRSLNKAIGVGLGHAPPLLAIVLKCCVRPAVKARVPDF